MPGFVNLFLWGEIKSGDLYLKTKMKFKTNRKQIIVVPKTCEILQLKISVKFIFMY